MEFKIIGARLHRRTPTRNKDRPRRCTQQTCRCSHAQQLPKQGHHPSGAKERHFLYKKTTGSHSSNSDFFLDDEGAMYRRQQNGKLQLVVPETLIQEVIRENHDPIFVAHTGIRRT